MLSWPRPRLRGGRSNSRSAGTSTAPHLSIRSERAHYGERKPEIPYAIDDECFLGRVPGFAAVEVIADQQVRAQPHTFPSDLNAPIMASANPKSPMRLTTNAFLAASPASRRSK